MSTASTPQTTPSVRLQVEDSIAWITFYNPDRMNALTAAMWAAIPTHVANAEADPAVRVIVVRGGGERAFSAGADISEFEIARTGDGVKSYDALNDAAFNALHGAQKPTIAMVHGFCLGGGLGIAACCDLRLADDKATFAVPAVKLGIGYNQRWVRPLLALASPPHVKELLFTGRRFTATDALAMGLVNRVVPTEQLGAETRALSTEIAHNAPLSVRAAKAAIDELVRHPEQADTARLDRLTQACFDSNDYAEGRRAFLDKRNPQFRGQ